MTKHKTLGNVELQIFNYVIDHAPISVREVAAHFAETSDLARTTILTVLERLRKKKLLKRKKISARYHYLPCVNREALLLDLVGEFVEKTLGGNLSPFTAYLARQQNLSQPDIDELRRVVQALRDQDSKKEA